jgi:hypothetical protein
MMLVSLSLLSCAWGATIMMVPVKEVDFPADDQQPIWLDNTRVLFSGGSERERSPDKKARAGTPGLYIWDLKHETITKEPRFNYLGQLCVNGRFISYHEGGRRQVFVDDQPVEVPNTYWFNPKSCRTHTTKPAWDVDGRSTIPLLEEHGYIDIGGKGQEMSSNVPWLYYRAGREQPVPLGLGSYQINSSIKYYPFLDAYLLEATRAALWAPALWLLHPNGTVEQIFNPEGKAWAKQSWSWLVLTKRGVVFGKVTHRGSEARDSGLYMWENGTLTEVLGGVFASGVAVSRDGCKLAGIKKRLERPLPGNELYRLQIIDLCRGGSK